MGTGINFQFEHVVIVFLVVYTILRECFYLYSLQKLINKIMSRNYHEFKYVADNSLKNEYVPPRMDQGIPEDFGSMAGIG